MYTRYACIRLTRPSKFLPLAGTPRARRDEKELRACSLRVTMEVMRERASLSRGPARTCCITLLTVTVVLLSRYNSHVPLSALPSASLPRRIYFSPAMSTVNRGEKVGSTLSRGPGGQIVKRRPAFEWLTRRLSASGAASGAPVRPVSTQSGTPVVGRKLVLRGAAGATLPFGDAPVPPWQPPRSTSSSRPVVHISYVQRRAPVVVARPVGQLQNQHAASINIADGVAGDGVPPYSAAEFRAAASSVVAKCPVFDRRRVVDATDRGEVVGSATMRSALLRHELARLVTLLPLESVARFCNRTVRPSCWACCSARSRATGPSRQTIASCRASTRLSPTA